MESSQSHENRSNIENTHIYLSSVAKLANKENLHELHSSFLYVQRRLNYAESYDRIEELKNAIKKYYDKEVDRLLIELGNLWKAQIL